jgi:phage terminase large subunit GpA-like protein
LKQTEVFRIKKQPWFPEVLNDYLDKKKTFKFETGFSKSEKKLLRKRKKLKISNWVEKNIWVRVSSKDGQWSNSVTPYLTDIMDAVGEPFVHDLTICATPQVGKTSLGYNCLGSWIDQDPGPAMIVFADEQTAKDELTERITPMIDDSPRLSGYKTSKMADMTQNRLILKNMVVHMAWATSVARLATKPKRYIIFDEIDKYPSALKKETDPISLGIKRTRTYPDDKKIIKISTPTWESGPIWQSWLDAQVRFRYFVKCPDCGTMQIMEFGEKDQPGGIKFPPDERDPSEIETRKLAWYECAECKSKWDDKKRNQAVLLGKWRDEKSGKELTKYLQLKKPSKIAFHIPAWLSTFVSLSECAAAFLKGQTSKVLLRDFMNAYASNPWIEFEVDRKEETLLALKDHRERGSLPESEKIFCLTAAVDTQDDGFWYEIRGWGIGHALESWQIREGFIPANWTKLAPGDLVNREYHYHPAFDPLRQILWEIEYYSLDGKGYKPMLVGIDAMGHHTTEVYDFCRFNRGKIYPIQGMNSRSNRPYKYSKLDTYPGSNKTLPGGLTLLQLDVNHYKDELSGKLQISSMDPGAWHFHSDTTKDWVQMLCVEYLDDKTGRWACPEKAANHGWDCSVYNLALADVLAVKIVSQQKQKKEVQKKKAEKKNPFLNGNHPFAR